MFGVIMEQGPKNWQIVQQENGFGTISASGQYQVPETMPNITEPVVYLRVVREDSGQDITGWQAAETREDGKWNISFSVPAGGLYRLESCILNADETDFAWGVRGDMRHHLGVGDLYVIAGQSNASGYGKDPIFDPPEMGVHVLRNSMDWDLATHPLNESTDSRHTENMESANPGASPYLSFGKMLRRELGYPIGLLQASLGGSPLSKWNPEEDGCLYREMMKIIDSQGGKITGVLWYQGCADCKQDPSDYLNRFRHVVEQFRKDAGAEVPWLTVQLAAQTEYGRPETEAGWGMVREAQRQAARMIPGVSVIPANDSTMSDTVHVSAAFHLVLGERLAGAALRHIYGRKYGSDAPDIESASLKEPSVMELQFANVTTSLFRFGLLRPAKRLFTVMDDEGENPVEKFSCKENVLRLELQRPVRGKNVTVSGGWRMMQPVLMPIDNSTHMPMLSFYQFPVKTD